MGTYATSAPKTYLISNLTVVMTDSVYYIPPEGLAFHLVGHASRKALVSRSSRDPHVTQKSFDKESSEQLFTLLYGSAERGLEGRYALISKATGHFITSRHTAEDNPVWRRSVDVEEEEETDDE